VKDGPTLLLWVAPGMRVACATVYVYGGVSHDRVADILSSSSMSASVIFPEGAYDVPVAGRVAVVPCDDCRAHAEL